MTPTLAEIWRFPIKSHGREKLDATTLTQGQTIPGDRLWAVAHDQSDADGAEWVPCNHFTRVTKAAGLQAISAAYDDATGEVTLTHPDRTQLRFNPDTEGAQLIAWSKGFVPETRAQSARVVRARTHGFTDSDYPSVTLCNFASHRAVEQKLGTPLSPLRWRGNLWLDGLAPWEEFDWIDREVQIGEAVLAVRERTERCIATHANPETGRADHNLLSVLDTWGHRDFSVLAEVIRPGRIATGDKVTLL